MATRDITFAQLSVSNKVTWVIATQGSSFISGTYSTLLPIFYQDYLCLAACWIIIASAIYAVWNAINNPLIGYITDNAQFLKEL